MASLEHEHCLLGLRMSTQTAIASMAMVMRVVSSLPTTTTKKADLLMAITRTGASNSACLSLWERKDRGLKDQNAGLALAESKLTLMLMKAPMTAQEEKRTSKTLVGMEALAAATSPSLVQLVGRKKARLTVWDRDSAAGKEKKKRQEVWEASKRQPPLETTNLEKRKKRTRLATVAALAQTLGAVTTILV